MLKSIQIQNFESHENTIVKFDNGFNLIWGKSDSGKSSILRALAVVVNNQFSSKMVREGFAYCEIEVTTDKGKVNCKRGEGVNKWIVTDSEGTEHCFDKIGKTVPDLASDILGMREKQWGKKLSELPNFMFQDEKHYMLSEIGGEKSTSNMVARLMDKTIGLGGIEELVKEISSNITKNRKRITELQNKQSEIKSGMLSEEIIESYENKIESINRTKNEIIELEDKQEFLKQFVSFVETLNNKKEKNERIKDYLQEIIKEHEDCKNNVKQLNAIKEINNTKEILEKKKNKLEKLNGSELIQQELEEIRKEIDEYWEFHEFVQKYLNDKIKLNKSKNRLKEVYSEIDKQEEDLHKLKDDLGVCPLCGKTFE